MGKTYKDRKDQKEQKRPKDNLFPLRKKHKRDEKKLEE